MIDLKLLRNAIQKFAEEMVSSAVTEEGVANSR